MSIVKIVKITVDIVNSISNERLIIVFMLFP